jgi:hypothetical protein
LFPEKPLFNFMKSNLLSLNVRVQSTPYFLSESAQQAPFLA